MAIEGELVEVPGLAGGDHSHAGRRQSIRSLARESNTGKTDSFSLGMIVVNSNLH